MSSFMRLLRLSRQSDAVVTVTEFLGKNCRGSWEHSCGGFRDRCDRAAIREDGRSEWHDRPPRSEKEGGSLTTDCNCDRPCVKCKSAEPDLSGAEPACEVVWARAIAVLEKVGTVEPSADFYVRLLTRLAEERTWIASLPAATVLPVATVLSVKKRGRR